MASARDVMHGFQPFGRLFFLTCSYEMMCCWCGNLLVHVLPLDLLISIYFSGTHGDPSVATLDGHVSNIHQPVSSHSTTRYAGFIPAHINMMGRDPLHVDEEGYQSAEKKRCLRCNPLANPSLLKEWDGRYTMALPERQLRGIYTWPLRRGCVGRTFFGWLVIPMCLGPQ